MPPTSSEVTNHLKNDKGESLSQLEYSCTMRSVIYVMDCTKLDISNNVVSRLNRYTHNIHR